MKKILFLFSIIAVSLSLASHALAYDYRSVTLTEKEQNKLNKLADDLLIPANNFDAWFQTIEGLSSEDFVEVKEIHWKDARQAYNFAPEDFLNALESGGWDDALANKSHIFWKIPLNDYRDYHIYALTTDPNNEEVYMVYVSVTGPSLPSAVEHMYMENPIPETVDTGGASVYLTSIEEFDVDFITVIKNESVTLIPYAVSPDFIKLENGRAYTAEEVHSALSAYMEEIKNPMCLDPNAVEDFEDVRPFISLSFVLLLIIGVVAASIVSKSRNRENLKTEPQEED